MSSNKTCEYFGTGRDDRCLGVAVGTFTDPARGNLQICERCAARAQVRLVRWPVKFYVFCADGNIRHDDDFADRAAAAEWAYWGHCCTAVHEIVSVDVEATLPAPVGSPGVVADGLRLHNRKHGGVMTRKMNCTPPPLSHDEASDLCFRLYHWFVAQGCSLSFADCASVAAYRAAVNYRGTGRTS